MRGGALLAMSRLTSVSPAQTDHLHLSAEYAAPLIVIGVNPETVSNVKLDISWVLMVLALRATPLAAPALEHQKHAVAVLQASTCIPTAAAVCALSLTTL